MLAVRGVPRGIVPRSHGFVDTIAETRLCVRKLAFGLLSLLTRSVEFLRPRRLEIGGLFLESQRVLLQLGLVSLECDIHCLSRAVDIQVCLLERVMGLLEPSFRGGECFLGSGGLLLMLVELPRQVLDLFIAGTASSGSLKLGLRFTYVATRAFQMRLGSPYFGLC